MQITKEQVLNAPKELQVDKLFDYMAQTNKYEFNINKALEEAVEFMEVLIKIQTKSKKNPRRLEPEDAIAEFGDMLIRGTIALRMMFPNKDVQSLVAAHIQNKTDKLLGWLEKGTYVNGL